MADKSDEQKDAESGVEGFKESLGPFVVAAETTRMAMVFADAKRPDNPIIFANDSFLSLTGYHRAEVLGKCFNFLMADAADADALARIKAEKVAQIAVRRFFTAARMAASSGPPSSSARSGMRTGILFSIFLPSLTLLSTRTSRLNRGCSSTN